jgi:hypothetical protein
MHKTRGRGAKRRAAQSRRGCQAHGDGCEPGYDCGAVPSVARSGSRAGIRLCAYHATEWRWYGNTVVAMTRR